MKALIDHFGYVPESCVWEITRACNLRCGHCGTSAGKPRPHELSTCEAIDVARQLARLGNRLTTLSGGEPTLRDDWPEIARALIEAGVTVNMVTNGQSSGAELAEKAKEVGLANVAVSVDGLEPTHDGLRGSGAYARTVDTIRTLVASGIWVDVMLTVNRKNIAEIIDTWELTKQLGAKRFRVQLGKPMGNQTHRDDLTLRPADLLVLMPLLGSLAGRRGPGVRIGDSVGFYSPEERVLRGQNGGPRHWTGCYAGVRAIGIQADGGVKGCLSLQPRSGQSDRFVEGNLHQESLESIWFRPGAFAYNRDFQLGNLKGACAKCSHATLCRGGATCVAYAFAGELGCDPMCYFQVAGLSEATRQRVWPMSAQAAAAALMLSIGGCGGKGGDGSAAKAAAGTGSSVSADADAGVIGSGGYPNAALDYGVWAPEETGGQSEGGTGGEPTPQLDYGVMIPSGGTGGQVTSAGGTGGAPTPQLDYGVMIPSGGTGGQVTSAGGTGGRATNTGGTGGEATHAGGSGGEPMVYPDYGVMLPEGGKGGQSTSAAGAAGQPTAVLDYGVMPPEGGSGGQPMVYPDYGVIAPEGGTSGVGGSAGGGSANVAGGAGETVIECSTICCECEYGIIEPEAYRACCCQNVCCDCDYGVSPPAGCCG